MKVNIIWRRFNDLDFTWCAVNVENGDIVARGFKHCEEILYWCETHNVEVVDVDYHGTRI